MEKVYTIPLSEKNQLVSNIGVDVFYEENSQWKITNFTIDRLASEGIDLNAACNSLFSETFDSRYDSSSVYTKEGYRSSFLHCSGRFYSYTDGRWVTESDDNYGNNLWNFSESGGSGSNPVFEWEHLGTPLPEGTIIKNLNFVCRTNNTQTSDFELLIVQRKPNPITRWSSGIDNDGEMTNNIVFRGFWTDLVPSYSGSSNDIHGATIPLDFTLDDFSMMSIYIKPVETNSSTRYIYSTWTWEIV